MDSKETNTDPTIVNDTEHNKVETTGGNHVTSYRNGDALLDPNFEFSKDAIAKNIHKSDKAFAWEVVNLVARAAERGVFACTTYGFPFLESPTANKSPLKITTLDYALGYNALSYESRFDVVADLAKEDLEKREFKVRTLKIYASEWGIIICWALDIPSM